MRTLALALGFIQPAHVDLLVRGVRAQFQPRAFSRHQVLQPLRFLLTHRALLLKAVGVSRSRVQGKDGVNRSLTINRDVPHRRSGCKPHVGERRLAEFHATELYQLALGQVDGHGPLAGLLV